MTTGFCWHERFAWHDTGSAALTLLPGPWVQPETHVESPESKRRLRNLLEVSGLLDQLAPVPPRPATADELARFHTRDYIARIQALSADRGGNAGESTPFGRGSYEIAALAAGGALAMVDALMAGHIDNGYALVRPPGHHAERDRGRGFCIFNNVALAALHAQAVHGVGRIAIVDWDVHHGNGTQQAFEGDPSVLFISLHQDRLYPTDSGTAEERGTGAGAGYTVNLPLPPGSGRGAYEHAFERVVEPRLRAFRPELILVSSGFDAGGFEPLGRMMLSSTIYRELTRRVMAVAAECCDGRLLLVHEGGYSTAYVPFCGLATIETLAGVRTAAVDPMAAYVDGWPYQGLQAHQREAIERVIRVHGDPAAEQNV